MEQNLPRSNSCENLPNEVMLDDEETLATLLTQVAQRVRSKPKQKRSGLVHVQQKSWLHYCCARSKIPWHKKYMVITNDRIILTKNLDTLQGSHILLRGLSVAVSSEMGHSNQFYCLHFQAASSSLDVSFESKESMVEWYIAILRAVEELADSSYFLN